MMYGVRLRKWMQGGLMSDQGKYAENQRTQYDEKSGTIEKARAQVAPNYEELRRAAPNFARMVINNYLLRRTMRLPQGVAEADVYRQLRVLDFGCGVGRVMEGFVEAGVPNIDGADISQVMLEHAKASALLAKSAFFLTSGMDAGNPPTNHYDIATAFLVLHHIPMRQTRIDILRSLANSLKDDGMVFIELKIFPGATQRRIPHNHASWDENMLARRTNSASDVWVTPDTLGMVYDDLRLFFKDIAMIESDSSLDYYNYNSEAIYQYGFNPVYFAGSKKSQLLSLLKGPVV